MKRKDKAGERERYSGGSESEVEDTKGLTAKHCCLMIEQTILGFDWT